MVDLGVDFTRSPYFRNIDNRTIVKSTSTMKTEPTNSSSKLILSEQQNNRQIDFTKSKTVEKETSKKSKKKEDQTKKKQKTVEAENEQYRANEKSKAKNNTKVVNKGKTYCHCCKKKCSGEVLRVQDKYFHIACFKCIVCKNSLAQGGFFCKDGNYYCTTDYQKKFGTKCAVCGDFVEGEVVSALGKTYHQKCFTCARCRQAFPSGERVTYTGKEVLCTKCMQIPIHDSQSLQSSPTSTSNTECAGCKEELKEGQALIALGRQWHIWCFKCKACSAVLHGEYMGKDGVPYCEKDYQKNFGVKCAYCSRYISGKVLQAGDNHHFHPTCARCTKCGDPFGDGEEMYLQGGAIWHPRCGPGPTENGTILNGSVNGHNTDTEGDSVKDTSRSTAYETALDTARSGGDFDRISNCAASEMQYSYQRAGSPGLILREYKTPQYREDISRIYTYSYLTEEPTHGYLKKPIDPYDKPPSSPHFHRPPSAHSLQGSSKSSTLRSSRSGMQVLVDSIRSETPRPRSPHMNNEEPIELSHYPAGHPPNPGEKPKIERDDFPAPPYPYTDPERRRRWSDSYKGVPISDDEDEVDSIMYKEAHDRKLKREEEELSKIASGIGKLFLQNVREREKIRAWKQNHLDPRNASRTPSAAKEPNYRLRYQSPINAFVSSHNVAPRPGYGLRANTLPATARFDSVDFSFSGLGEKTHSTDFSSGKSDMSGGSISEVDHGTLGPELASSSTYTGMLGYAASYSPYLRHSLPNMAAAHSSEPPKIYPYHLLLITNYRLPADVDRCNLERHLSEAEFETLFQCTRAEFYRLPQWRRNELKRRARLF